VREITAGSNSGDRYQREEGEVIAGKKVSVLTRGPTLSARREKEKGTDSGMIRWAAGSFFLLGRTVPFGPFFLLFFLFSFSGFPISFILFANLIQIKPNHFQKFSKNQCNDLTLQEN
jgi:hypothetical protein